MATAAHVELSPAGAGIYHSPHISSESAKVASQVLQKNHENHHIFFNSEGFHNHVAHHILTVFALGASPAEIQKAFDGNKGYQRPTFPVEDKIVADMTNKDKFNQYLGQEKYNSDYVMFFQREIEAKGWEATLNEHLFAGDAHSEQLLTRMFAGFFHPIIHLGFGIEFKQPAIIAEALAQAALHDNWIAKYLLGTDQAAAASAQESSKTMVDLIKATQNDEKLRNAAQWKDANKVRDGILVRAPDEFIKLAAQWRVSPEDLEEKTAEMINVDAYFTVAAQHPPKKVRIDFYYMHCMNSSIFFSTFLKEKWLSTENKIKLLEWKGRMDLALYASRHCPKLDLDEVTRYTPKNDGDWASIFRRVDGFKDDGHASKLIRALAHGQEACKPYEGKNGFMIKDEMWLKMGHMVIDSVEGTDYAKDRWVRSCGWDEAWEKIPDRAPGGEHHEEHHHL